MSVSKCAKINFEKVDKKVSLFIWIIQLRKLGSLLFLIGQDERDQIQIIVKEKKTIEEIEKRKKGDLLKINGIVRKKRSRNQEVEIELLNFKLINPSKELPFEIKDEINVSEKTRYTYRYLDLRRKRNRNLILTKNIFFYELRRFLHQKKFIDIETPILANYSPEGAQNFLVPSNLTNRAYFLPQSTQIFKQLLMVSWFSKYYQITKSFRNEGARKNRQIEFSQLELEMSFIDEKKIRKFIEAMLKKVLKKVFGLEVGVPFKTLTYQEAVKKYKTDKPDLRKNKSSSELAFCWITDWPIFTWSKKTKKYESYRHPFTAPKQKFINSLLKDSINLEKITGQAFDLICNGEEVLSGSIRIHQANLQKKIFEILNYNKREIDKFFGYFLRALEFAAPIHGGVGLGIDRLLAIICKVENLKELIAFPKSIDGTCFLTGAPNFIKEKDDSKKK